MWLANAHLTLGSRLTHKCLTRARDYSPHTSNRMSIGEAKMMRKVIWILGAMTSAGCHQGTEPLDPSAAAVLTAASPTSLTVPAGNSVTAVPAVIAHDANGAPLSGVIVTFIPEVGAGIVYGAVDTTDLAGVAQMGGWTPGTRAGERAVITARAPNGSAVVFRASIVPGAPFQILKLAGDNQVAVVNGQVAVSPRAKVVDGYGNAIPGAQVNFGVTRGGGSVSPSVSFTDQDGVVAVGTWSLGAAGEQTLAMEAGRALQLFHATALAIVSACSQQIEVAPSSARAFQLSGENCSMNGRYFNVFYFINSEKAPWAFEMRSAAFDSYLELRNANSTTIARNDNIEGSNDSRIRAVLPGGVYELIAWSNSPGIGGPFSLSIASVPPAPIGCEGLYVNRGDSISGGVVPLKCNGVDVGNTNILRIHLSAGEKIEIHARDPSYSEITIDLLTPDDPLVAPREDRPAFLDWRGTYTADKDMELVVQVSSLDWADYWITFK